MTVKRCPGCGETKPVEEFARARRERDGLQKWCRACKAERMRRYREENRAAARRRVGAGAVTVKRCPGCGETKPVEEFARNRSERDGRAGHCRACQAEQNRAYRERNREALRKRDRERMRAYREADPEAFRKRRREHNRAYRARAAARLAVEGPRRWAAREPFPADRLTREVGYQGAHARVRSWYGPAGLHACEATGCDRQAEEWAYVGSPETDVHHRTATKTDSRDGTTRKVSYSLNPARYAPLCHGCHVRHDRDVADIFAADDGALFSLTA